MAKRVTIRGSDWSGFEISYGGVRVGSAHNANGGPGWCVRSDEPLIVRRNSWNDGLRYETAKQAAQAGADYVRASLRGQR